MSDKTSYTIIVYSKNITGLLNQVTTVFIRRQMSIESLNIPASPIKGAYRYTITAWADKDTTEKVVKRIKKKIDMIQAHCLTEDKIYFHEIALYKVSTPVFQENSETSELIRRYNTRVVEVGPVFSIVERNRMSEDTTSLCGELKALNCVLQFARSEHIAITTNYFEWVNRFLDGRGAMYNQNRNQ